MTAPLQQVRNITLTSDRHFWTLGLACGHAKTVRVARQGVMISEPPTMLPCDMCERETVPELAFGAGLSLEEKMF